MEMNLNGSSFERLVLPRLAPVVSERILELDPDRRADYDELELVTAIALAFPVEGEWEIWPEPLSSDPRTAFCSEYFRLLPLDDSSCWSEFEESLYRAGKFRMILKGLDRGGILPGSRPLGKLYIGICHLAAWDPLTAAAFLKPTLYDPEWRPYAAFYAALSKVLLCQDRAAETLLMDLLAHKEGASEFSAFLEELRALVPEMIARIQAFSSAG